MPKDSFKRGFRLFLRYTDQQKKENLNVKTPDFKSRILILKELAIETIWFTN